MSGDDQHDDFQSWASAWQADEAADAVRLPPIDADALRRRSRRYRAGMIWLTIGELATCLVVLAWLAARAWRAETAAAWAGFGLALALVAFAEWLVLTSRRGTYHPANQTLRAYLDLEILRAERQLRTARAIVPFVLVETLLVFAWRYWELSALPTWAERWPEYLAQGVWISLILIGLTLLGAALWRRRVSAQLVERRALRRALDGGEEPPVLVGGGR
jgi:hypothetical protein